MVQPLGLQTLRWTADLSQTGLTCVLQILNLSVTSAWGDEEIEVKK